MCRLKTSFETDNGGELDIGEADSRFDEFNVLLFEIEKIFVGGKRRYRDFLSVD